MEQIQKGKIPARVRLKRLILEADEQQLERIVQAIHTVVEDNCSHELLP